MLSITSSGQKLCDGISRREILRIGGLGVCGLGLSHLLGNISQASSLSEPGKVVEL